jgi:hypothetical protein
VVKHSLQIDPNKNELQTNVKNPKVQRFFLMVNKLFPNIADRQAGRQSGRQSAFRQTGIKADKLVKH